MTCGGFSCVPSEGDVCSDQGFQSGKYVKACALAQEQSHVIMTNISDHRKGRGREEGMVSWVGCSDQEEKDVI